VPDIQKLGPVGLFLNPLTFLWNRVVGVLPVEPSEPAASPAPQPGTTRVAAARFHDQVDDRVFPPGLEAFRPSNVFHFLFGWCECWLFSRSYRDLLAGIPFVAATACGVFLIWWLRHASQNPAIANYEAAYNAESTTGDERHQEIFLRAFCYVRPMEPQYRFRLGHYLLKKGRLDEGLEEILRLATESGNGTVDARKWLV